MNQRPVIGISCSIMKDAGGIFPGYPRAYVNDDYVRAVLAAGGLPLLLPFSLDEAAPKEYLAMVDGLLLSGGHDVAPQRYGEEPKQKIGEVFPERDAFDLALLKEALNQNIPIMGICRGFQIINVHFGGTLLQDLSYSEAPLQKHMQGHTPQLGTHRVEILPGSRMASLLGEEIMVNSFHHQTVLTPGDDLLVCARALDGTIEAVESKEQRILATQWHPEMMAGFAGPMKKLFEDFVAESRKEVGKKEQ
ncbi:Glutamine amidotransferase, class I [Clostridiaceae bacterium JG1575]|nr:Glutamine amidotransferase, class I [Clostridiaceae bacterium JG1575]